MSRGVTTGEGGRDVLLGQGRAKEIGKESVVEGKVGNQHPYLRAVDAQNGTLYGYVINAGRNSHLCGVQ